MPGSPAWRIASRLLVAELRELNHGFFVGARARDQQTGHRFCGAIKLAQIAYTYLRFAR
jgi:hypothetical protein